MAVTEFKETLGISGNRNRLPLDVEKRKRLNFFRLYDSMWVGIELPIQDPSGKKVDGHSIL